MVRVLAGLTDFEEEDEEDEEEPDPDPMFVVTVSKDASSSVSLWDFPIDIFLRFLSEGEGQTCMNTSPKISNNTYRYLYR